MIISGRYLNKLLKFKNINLSSSLSSSLSPLSINSTYINNKLHYNNINRSFSNINKNMEDVKMSDESSSSTTTTTTTNIEPTTNTTNTTTTTTTPNLLSNSSLKEIENSSVVKIVENSTTILYNNQNEVFYNPVQEFNRDMSILMIKLFIEEKKRECKEKGKAFKKVRVLEALSATGLRSIRYAKEIGDDLDYILANDIEQSAVDSIIRNREYNGVEECRIRPNLGDASIVMMQNRSFNKSYDIVDVDPYGAPTQFLDSAVQAVSDGGLLCVTATDSAVLCGSYPEACFHKYQSVPVNRAGYCHEMGLRILLHSIEQHANRYKRHIVPILSLSVDFYVRVFVRVYYSPSEAKKAFSKMTNVYSCSGCGSFHLQPLGVVKQEGNSIKYKVPTLNKEMGTRCEHCTKQFHVAGPFWAQRLHNQDICKSALKFLEDNPKLFNTSRRMYGILTSVIDELPDQLFYYKTDHFTHTLHLSTPPTPTIKSAILNGGYKVSSSHVLPCIKTDAPFEFIWDIFRTYAKEKPPKNLGPETPAHFILSKEPKHKIDFTNHPLAKGEHPDVPKYFPNPKENWGPGSRASGKNNINNKRNSNDANVGNTPEKNGKNKQQQQQRKKKKEPTICKYFIYNKCAKGDECENIHEKPLDSTIVEQTETTISSSTTTSTTTN